MTPKALPNPDEHPDFFTPDGRMLHRATPQGAQVNWNTNYSNQDPSKSWIGKWFNPELNEDEFTYLHDDLAGNEKLSIHLQIAQVATQLPKLRSYVSQLLSSSIERDQLIGLALLLLDQGQMKVQDVATLVPTDIQPQEPLVSLKGKTLHLDHRTIEMLIAQMKKDPEMPIFSTEANGEIRMMGPNFFEKILEGLGISYNALQLFHINKNFVSTMTTLLQRGTALDQATLSAVHASAGHAGYEMTGATEEIAAFVLSFIDQIFMQHVEETSRAMELEIDGPDEVIPQSIIPIVNSSITAETEEEKAYGDFLRTLDLHSYL